MSNVEKFVEKFVSDPVEVFAIRRISDRGSRDAEIITWVQENGGETGYSCRETDENGCVQEAGHDLYIITPEGSLRVDEGDWVIRGPVGEHLPCEANLFVTKYLPIKEATFTGKATDVKVKDEN